MKTLSSSEFRRTFARLTEPVTVTVLGRPIAVYTPALPEAFKAERRQRTIAALEREAAVTMGEPGAVVVTVPDLGDTQMSFRPAPKPVRKKR
jgi:antitoxin (DNA-binding transcriptional repressor) of toxin-antitoxin stability system